MRRDYSSENHQSACLLIRQRLDVRSADGLEQTKNDIITLAWPSQRESAADSIDNFIADYSQNTGLSGNHNK